MDSKMIREINELTEMAHELSSIERRLLFNLDEKGPGLLLELAVRTLHFPEEVSAPLADLRNRGLVRSDAFEGGQFGNELIYLSKRGDKLVALLREEAIHPHHHHHHHMDHGLESMNSPAPTRGVTEPSASPDSRQQEVELLNKLGDLESKSGNADEARKHYQEALKIARGITTTSSEVATISHATGAGTGSVETSTTTQPVLVSPPPTPCVGESAGESAEDALEDLPHREAERNE